MPFSAEKMSNVDMSKWKGAVPRTRSSPVIPKYPTAQEA